ncbi:FHA domain-containing protein, partial [Actinomyces slackii]
MVPTALVVRLLSAQASSEPQTFTEAFTVGRAPDSGVQIIHPLVSRTHLRLTPTPTGWQVTCHGRNGMLVNGAVTREALITAGTRIQLGDASGPALGLTPIASQAPAQAPQSMAPQGMAPQGAPMPGPVALGPSPASSVPYQGRPQQGTPPPMPSPGTPAPG